MAKPRPIEDLAGKTYGRLTFIEPVRKTSQGTVWLCKCSCGNLKEALRSQVLSGNTRSCGCLKREQGPKNAKSVHGHNRVGKVSRTYTAWRAMLARCLNKNHVAYHRYGGAGIDIHQEWQADFTVFLADMGEVPEGHSLDRIDGAKGYTPDNCRWASREQQARNKKTNVLLTYDGRTQCASAWAKEAGVHPNLILNRVKAGWSAEAAITTPVINRKRSIR